MKKIVLFLCISLLFFQCKKNNDYQINHEQTVQQHIIKNLQNLSEALQNFERLAQSNASESELQQHFLKCRLLFKNTEWATEYFLPKSSKLLNGPALDHLDLEENKFLDAEGFQVLEEYLYPHYQKEQQTEIIKQIRIIDNLIRAGITNFEATKPSKEQVFDALRLGIFKITTLGITGFDTPVSSLLFPESQAALKGIEDVLNIYKNELQRFESFQNSMELLRTAQTTINQSSNKNTFDYLGYIINYLDPIAQKIHQLQLDAQIPFVKRVSMLKPDAASLFARDAFDLNAVSADQNLKSNPEKIELGKKLFYDTHLSKNNTRSCASCHDPEKAFTDGLKVASDLAGSPLLRNTPSLNYAGFYHGQFWDMRQADIESLTTNVIENQEEMHGNMADILKMVQTDEYYATSFKKIYKDNKIEGWHVQNALASYVRSLSTFSSRFDDYMRGEKTALTSLEKEGFNVFVGKAKCATCHFLPIFNGTVPPRFSSSEQEVLGVPADVEVTILDNDLGRYIYNTDLYQLKNAFKTVTVRNIEKTAPYMHNGVFKSLEEVVNFYNKGGGLGFGLSVENQTLPADALDLSEHEQKALIAFMKALNDQ
ncbi:cytochrome-c peroxidase [Paenimyroides aestuarii]|uniref:Cytochrome-c peroxidase n=1 Tax=Paenimyroides aestuarii TaxID=2968490 RepID=A0ABY5NRX6_9FLAO|nr:cytochrome c peroxidase [Paenimyroides aestuarii]UUV21325.1 cytochrome-c peroxidase [Paenimyroides aestuarii]